ncbi:MAG: ATP-dependent helicase HrpB [bacterium]
MSEALPIYDLDEEIISALSRGNRLILQAPTGSGKSTQVPQMLLDGEILAGGRCVILQPRRLAARMLATRVASERSCRLGGEVGYQIRLDNVSSTETKILFVTEGILLRQMLADPLLGGISTLVFDEFHERHLYGDITLARALDLQDTVRPDLKIVVMSATLDGAELREYLEPTEMLTSEGRTFPVEISHLSHDPKDDPVWETATDAVAEHYEETEGDVLVFMPGAYEIQRTIRELQARLGGRCAVLPLHGELPAAEQDRAVNRSQGRKIIVSTNVAETSLTIDGVTLVVDSGLARVARYDPNRGINTLLIEKVSVASAAQRAGRAGRTAPGHCVRLWTERDHARRPLRELPEVKRLDLSETLLSLKASGVEDLQSFRWIERPEPQALARAETLLRDLGALNAAGEITPIGCRMLNFPVHPRYARMFIAAEELGCVRAAALIAALTQTRSMLLRVDKKTEDERAEIFSGGTSDFLVLMRVFEWAKARDFRMNECRSLGIHSDSARQVAKIFEQFLDIAHSEALLLEDTPPRDSDIAKCVLAGFADQVGVRRGAGTLVCDIVHGRRGLLARQSVACASSLLVAAEIAEIEGRDGDARVLLSLATEIEESWLRDMFPQDFSESAEHFFDKSQNRVVVRRAKVYRDLVLETRDRDAEPGPAAASCLADQVLEDHLRLNGWDDAVEQWMHRVNFLARLCPEQNLPPMGAEERHHVILLVCEGAVCYRDIKDAAVLPHAKSLLTWEQQQFVEKHAPERIELPGGRRAKVTYAQTADPFLSARIQDFYGVADDIKIALGRHALTLHILAPSHRPVQVTRSLKSFWSDTYPTLKQQLQRQYPKHEWR